jgi:undecaprenyl pyrophosphate phosphatase UppP
MKKIWGSIKNQLLMIWKSFWYIIVALILAVIAGIVFDRNIAFWVFFSSMLSVIAFVFARQLWWYVSGTGDYYGRVGFLKGLWNKVSKK